MDNQTCQGCDKYRCARAQTLKSLYASDTGMSKDVDLVMNVVTRTSDLVSACQRLRGVDYITVDTEFIRDNTYWPQICLIQVASEDEAVAIDPLSRDLELKPFLEILTDENVLKVFHAARQDVEIFYQLGKPCRCPFSTPSLLRWSAVSATPWDMTPSSSDCSATPSTNHPDSPTGPAAL